MEAMAQLAKIRVCAELAKFAYIASNPEMRASTDELRRTPRKLPDYLSRLFKGHQVIDFKEYHTRSHIHSHEDQHRFFRSNSYLLHLRKEDGADTIVVGFRGTFNYTTPTGENFINNGMKHGQQRFRSRLINWVLDTLAPSNYGLSDFYYDATIVRVPYRKGSVWKWYAYWGTLLLERTQCAPDFLGFLRRVAMDWVSRPCDDSSEQSNSGHVHLGFWSLWVSPEGFAGYNDKGLLPKGRNHNSLLQHCNEVIEQAKREKRQTEILVVGHSLGGAVSCFAALDIAAVLKEGDNCDNVSLFHVTFGAPPVGTADFAGYFQREITPYKSWAILHHRDIVPQFFAFCGSKSPSCWQGWWSNWSRVGEQMHISKVLSSQHQSNGDKSMTSIDKLKWAIVGLGTLAFLISSNVLCFIGGSLWYLRHWKDVKGKENSRGNSVYPKGKCDLLITKEVGLEYHSIQRYIDLLGSSDVFTVSDEMRRMDQQPGTSSAREHSGSLGPK